MKKVTFDKAVRASSGWWRKDYPGYLFRHSCHPGRDFVIARGSQLINRDDPAGFKHNQYWYLYDRQSGIAIDSIVSKTREGVYTGAIMALERRSPAEVQAAINHRVMLRATKVLQETP